MKLVFFVILFFSLFTNADDIPISHAPIGIMGDHNHKEGEVMISLRHSSMSMKGTLQNGEVINNLDILNLPNPYSSMLNAPNKLSVIPIEMNMKMIMLGGMFAYSDKLTLMSMLTFKDIEMVSETYRGLMNRDYLGSFKISNSALSSLSIVGLFSLVNTEQKYSNILVGIKESFGKNDRQGKVLTPMNTQMNMLMPYAMQISDKSTNLNLGYTQKIFFSKYSVGYQLKTSINLNKHEWAYGDKYEANFWMQKQNNNNLSWSLRFHHLKEEIINGRNLKISAPVQTANPLNYGGNISSIGIGLNSIFNLSDGDHADRLALEVIYPISQNKKGLQMKSKEKIIFGYQKSF